MISQYYCAALTKLLLIKLSHKITDFSQLKKSKLAQVRTFLG